MSPADHVRMLVEVLRPAGAELTRRWVAALLRVPAEDRAEVVEAVERRVADVYQDVGSRSWGAVPRAGAGAGAGTGARAGAEESRLVDVVLPPQQRAGYVEQQVVTYEKVEPKASGAGKRRKAK